MSPRLAGAVIALTAAAVLAASVVGSIIGHGFAWWDGHPTLNGEVIKAKTVHVGPLGGTGCNTGGDDTCSRLSLSSGFTTTGYVEAGACGVLVLSSVILALLAFSDNERRKQVGVVVMVAAGATAVGAVALAVVGPHVTTAQVSMPIGPGMGLMAMSLIGSMIGAVLARKANPPLTLRSSRRPADLPRAVATQAPPAPAPAPAYDVASLVQQDALRPTSLGPEPMIGRPPPSPGGMLPGPAGPLGAPQPAHPSASPLFSSAPQLRPLYDAAPAQGGSGGFVPAPPAALPTRAPTPIPRDSVRNLLGMPTPPPMQVPVVRPPVVASPPQAPPERPSAPPTTPFVRPDSALATADADGWNLDPRGPTVPAMPATLPERPVTTRGAAMPPDPGSRPKAASIPPPRPKPPSIAPPMPAARGKLPSIAPPMPGAPRSLPVPAGARTKAASVVPPPRPTPSPLAKANPTIAAAVVPPPPLANTMLPVRADTEPGDLLPTVGFVQPRAPTEDGVFDARATVARDAEVAEVGDHTDASIATPDPDASVGEHTDASIALPPEARARSESEEAATRAVEKVSSAELHAEPAPSASTSVPKIPVSTAPDSLPPPTEKQAASSGPSPACPQCEAPMAWVEEHLRFYCKSCRMYF